MSTTGRFPLILASTSKYRGILLGQLGYTFTTAAPDVDEDAYKDLGHSTLELSRILAHAKANAVYKHHPGSCVIGSDQVCDYLGTILSKPKTKERAIEQLLSMQGQSHQLITSVTVICPEGEETFSNTTTLTMRRLSLDEITKYIETDLPLDCAGSYKLESAGIKLFSKIKMDDHTSIIGLPLIQLTTALHRFGHPIF